MFTDWLLDFDSYWIQTILFSLLIQILLYNVFEAGYLAMSQFTHKVVFDSFPKRGVCNEGLHLALDLFTLVA